MTVLLDGVLSPDELEQIRSLLADGAVFEDGARTAGWAAREVKLNEQVKEGARLESVRRLVRRALDRHVLFRAWAQPKEIFRILASRYQAGMAYGQHVDDAIMSGRRADLSFTLFLNSPDRYEGGELILDGPDGETAIRLQPGQAVLYPTGQLHRVSEVTTGERLAIVGWVQSLVRRADQREILFDLDQTIAVLRQTGTERAVLDTLLKTRANLLRQWADV